MVVLQGLVSGIASAGTTDELIVIVYDHAVCACLQELSLDNVQVIQADTVFDLVDKMVVPFRVRSAVLKYQCDVLITLNFHVPLLPVPQIVYHVDLERFEHHSIFPLSLGSLLEKVRDKSAKRALRKADANVFESHFVYKVAQAHCKVPIQNPSVIYIGIDSNNLKDTNAIGTKLDKGLIVVVSSPLAYKHNEALVPVLVELKKRSPETNWRIRLFGGQDISVWSELIHLTDAADVRDRFEFLGFQARSVLNDSLDVAVCELNTSRLESFCMVALEAMARGCPVIVSGDASMPESVGDAGIVLDPDKSSAIADKIIQLNCANGDRLNLKKRSIVWASRHTWERSGVAFRELCFDLRTS